MNPIDKLLPKLQKVRKSSKNRWFACCPAHDDTNPSLSIVYHEDSGGIGLRCFGQGCSTRQITNAVGLEPSDLFPEKELPADYPFQRPRQKSLSFYETLALIREDLLTVSIGIAQLKRGHLLTLDDLERLDTAALRCYAIATQSF